MTPAIDIKASDVQKLRQLTGAGLMDCKRALSQAQGDIEKAIRLLREKGIAKSSKRSDRVAGEGLLVDWISEDRKAGVLLEVNCETDFVARNEEFLALAKSLLKKIQENSSLRSVEELPTDEVAVLSAKVGEKIAPRRWERYVVSDGGAVSSYIHPGSKLGVLVQIKSSKPGPPSQIVTDLAKELALQIAGASPTYLCREDVPEDLLIKEKEIAKGQMKDSQKPPDILEKIATGKLQQFFKAHCLLDQPHVRDSSGKTPVSALLREAAKKEGADLEVARFVRFRVGADQ